MHRSAIPIHAIGVALLLAFGCEAAQGPGRATHQVAITAMRFEPALIHVSVGDTVRWTNRDLVPHTATSAEGTFDSGDLPPDSLWGVVVERSGVLDYSCQYHPGMKGSIVADKAEARVASEVARRSSR